MCKKSVRYNVKKPYCMKAVFYWKLWEAMEGYGRRWPCFMCKKVWFSVRKPCFTGSYGRRWKATGGCGRVLRVRKRGLV